MLEFIEEQRSIQESVRDFAEKRMKPVVMEYDESQAFPFDIVKELAEMGCMGTFTSKYHGSGLGYTEYALIVEELARVDPSVAL
ncbi:MAG: acyl-CoA dehydrogenase family protein [Ignavibacteriales bacterium]|nr:acyl-CoA dehydrogenase family protein [Ignavibacteriales bacterium]